MNPNACDLSAVVTACALLARFANGDPLLTRDDAKDGVNRALAACAALVKQYGGRRRRLVAFAASATARRVAAAEIAHAACGSSPPCRRCASSSSLANRLASRFMAIRPVRYSRTSPW